MGVKECSICGRETLKRKGVPLCDPCEMTAKRSGGPFRQEDYERQWREFKRDFSE